MKLRYVFLFLILGFIYSQKDELFARDKQPEKVHWTCYTAYSYRPDEKNFIQAGTITCLLDEDNAKKNFENFFIIGRKEVNNTTEDVVIYSSEELWHGIFVYSEKQQLIILGEQPDNANFHVRLFYLSRGKWKTAPPFDISSFVASENWSVDKHWRGYLNKIKYHESEQKIEFFVGTVEGSYIITGRVNSKHQIVDCKTKKVEDKEQG